MKNLGSQSIVAVYTNILFILRHILGALFIHRCLICWIWLVIERIKIMLLDFMIRHMPTTLNYVIF